MAVELLVKIINPIHFKYLQIDLMFKVFTESHVSKVELLDLLVNAVLGLVVMQVVYQ